MLVPAKMAAVVVPAYATTPAPAPTVSTLAAMPAPTMPTLAATPAPAGTVPAPASAMATLTAVFSLDRAGVRNRQGHRSYNDES